MDLPSFASLTTLFPLTASYPSSPAVSIHGEHAHVLVESTTLHYWGSEGTGVERPRFGRGWRMRLWPIKGRGPFEVHRKLLWVVVCRCILCSIFLGGSGIVVGRGDSLFSVLKGCGWGRVVHFSQVEFKRIYAGFVFLQRLRW